MSGEVGDVVEAMISQAQISAKVQELGLQIARAYQQQDPVLISLEPLPAARMMLCVTGGGRSINAS